MKWIFTLPAAALLSACGFNNTETIAYRQVSVVPTVKQVKVVVPAVNYVNVVPTVRAVDYVPAVTTSACGATVRSVAIIPPSVDVTASSISCY